MWYCNCFQLYISNHLLSLWIWLPPADFKWIPCCLCLCGLTWTQLVCVALSHDTGDNRESLRNILNFVDLKLWPCGFMLCNKWWNMISWIHYMIMAGWFVECKIEVGNRWQQHPLLVYHRLFIGKKTELYEVQQLETEKIRNLNWTRAQVILCFNLLYCIR